MQEYTYPHVKTTCPECKHEDIVKDPFHDETYCTRCGLILSDNSIFQITHEISKTENKVKFIRNLWRKKR